MGFVEFIANALTYLYSWRCPLGDESKNKNQKPTGERMNKKKNSQRKLQKRLAKMIQKDGRVFWQALFQVTVFPQNFGFCECGRMPTTLNVHKSNYMYCKECRTYWHVGGNLFGSWRHEDESVWRENGKLLSEARPMESKHLFMSSGQLAMMTYEEVKEVERILEESRTGWKVEREGEGSRELLPI